jgi:hypothetical protein
VQRQIGNGRQQPAITYSKSLVKKNVDEKIKITHQVLPAGCQIWNSPPQTALGLM